LKSAFPCPDGKPGIDRIGVNRSGEVLPGTDDRAAGARRGEETVLSVE
jgi:hypothetical protein